MTPLPSFTGRKPLRPLLTHEQRMKVWLWRLNRKLRVAHQKPSPFRKILEVTNA